MNEAQAMERRILKAINLLHPACEGHPECEATDTERCPHCGKWLCTFCVEDEHEHPV